MQGEAEKGTIKSGCSSISKGKEEASDAAMPPFLQKGDRLETVSVQKVFKNAGESGTTNLSDLLVFAANLPTKLMSKRMYRNPLGIYCAVEDETCLSVRCFFDNDPREGVFYFNLRPPGHDFSETQEESRQSGLAFEEETVTMWEKTAVIDKSKSLLSVGMAFYNEDAIEVRRTLLCLQGQYDELVARGTKKEGSVDKKKKTPVQMETVLVSDGHLEMDASTRIYLKKVFCGHDANRWAAWHAMESLMASFRELQAQKDVTFDSSLTFVVQVVQRKGNKWSRVPVAFGSDPEKKMPVSLVLKADNRRKHNSGQWMLSAFGKQSFERECDYILLTDCGTLFDPRCLIRLVNYMDKEENRKCVGCTARQRVMAPWEQDEPFSLSVGLFFRLVQLVDYEASYPLYTAAFALVGFLPVLPGPCALFRFRALFDKVRTSIHRDKFCDDLKEYEHGATSADRMRRKALLRNMGAEVLLGIEEEEEEVRFQASFRDALQASPAMRSSSDDVGETGQQHTYQKPQEIRLNGLSDGESPMEHFHDLVSTPPGETDIVVENVKIAEDRIPSYAVVTHGLEGSYTTWVYNAVRAPTFKFQAETDVGKWIAQRRRWINGAFSSYIWTTLIHPSLISGSKVAMWRKVLIFVLLACQLLNYTISTLATSIFGAALHMSVELLCGPSLFQLSNATALANHTAPPVSEVCSSGLLADAITSVYMIIMFTFAWLHFFVKKEWTVIKSVVYLTFVVNAVVMFTIMLAVITALVKGADLFAGGDPVLSTIILWSTVVIMGTPFVASVLSFDLISFLLLTLGYSVYLFFLPSLVGTFSLYAVSRLWDTSWGNRATSARSAFKVISESKVQSLERDFRNNAGVALMFVTIANCILLFFVLFFKNNQIFLLTFISSLFLTQLIQFLMSVVFFLGRHAQFLKKLVCCEFRFPWTEYDRL